MVEFKIQIIFTLDEKYEEILQFGSDPNYIINALLILEVARVGQQKEIRQLEQKFNQCALAQSKKGKVYHMEQSQKQIKQLKEQEFIEEDMSKYSVQPQTQKFELDYFKFSFTPKKI